MKKVLGTYGNRGVASYENAHCAPYKINPSPAMCRAFSLPDPAYSPG